MRDNGTDRDVALQLLSALNTCAGLVESINDKLYAPHITTQPTDQEVGTGSGVFCYFTVVADNVHAYQWQVKTSPGGQWNNSSSSGNATSTLKLEMVSTSFYQYKFRCMITGNDNSVIYTNEVQPIAPDAQG